jgi:peptidoglycan-associated lipoprotein
MKKIALCLAATGLLGACASTPAPQAPAATPTSASSSNATGSKSAADSNAANSANLKASTLPAHRDPANKLAQQRSVYFDYDQYAVKQQYVDTVEAHAKYLQGNPGNKLKVEGNADERGSREYNLALGQKRAEAVKKLMVVTGAGESQVEAISWGKEKPKALGHDEAAWAENRRADIAYPDDKK